MAEEPEHIMVKKIFNKAGHQTGPGRGGKRAGAGCKAVDGVSRKTGAVQITALVTPEQREKFLDMGGSAWLRAMIDREFDNGV